MENSLDIGWTVTGQYRAVVSNDTAREIFGLGGTSDEDLPGRIEALTLAQPSLLLKLGAIGAYGNPVGYAGPELQSILDAKTGEPYYPEP
jgi:hypothetical protein